VSSRNRQRLALVALAFLVAWPPVQHAFVRSFDMDPWAFFGFAMYSSPNLRLNVRAASIEPGPDSVPDWNAIPAGVRDEVHAFALRRSRFGELLPPDALAEAIFASAPELPGVVVRVRRWVLERESARIAFRDRDYRYAPPADSQTENSADRR